MGMLYNNALVYGSTSLTQLRTYVHCTVYPQMDKFTNSMYDKVSLEPNPLREKGEKRNTATAGLEPRVTDCSRHNH